MRQSAVRQAAAMAGQGLPVLLATVDPHRVPHLTTVGVMVAVNGDCLRLTEWFCPRTVENAHAGQPAVVVVWDPARNVGWQLVGHIETVEEAAVMDGYDPNVPPAELPQTMRILEVRVDQAMRFHHGPHTDQEE